MLHHVIRQLFAKYKVETDAVLYKRQCSTLAILMIKSMGGRLHKIFGPSIQIRDQKRIQHVCTVKAQLYNDFHISEAKTIIYPFLKTLEWRKGL